MDQTWKHELIGSAAFLASSMKMPLTAIVLIFEFTRVGHDFLIPISLAVTGSVSAFHLCVERKTQPPGERTMKISRLAPEIQF
jgi:H+/Cl- antiporter ClcA